MLDGSWTASTTPDANWSALGASAAVFDGWENCGAKAEGSPSPSSTLTINADGSFSDNVFDGNPTTTVTIVDQRLQFDTGRVDALGRRLSRYEPG